MRTHTTIQCAQLAAEAGIVPSRYLREAKVIPPMTPAGELEFWRVAKRSPLLTAYLELKVSRLGMCRIRALRDELTSRSDLDVLAEHPDLAPVIVAIRDRLLTDENGVEWGLVLVPPVPFLDGSETHV